MRALARVIFIVALGGLLVYTNPTRDDFSDYVRQRVIQETQKKSQDPVLGQFFGSIVGGIAGGLVSNQTVRTDYLLFSTYNLQIGQEHLKALGVLKHFILLEKPDLKRYKGKAAPDA